jgi:hypothetical protein
MDDKQYEIGVSEEGVPISTNDRQLNRHKEVLDRNMM